MKKLTYSGGEEYRNKPANFDPGDLKLFQHEFQKKIFESYVYRFSNVYLLGKNTIRIKNSKLYLKHTYMSRPPLKNIIKVILRFFRQRATKVNNIDSGVWIINNKSENYFHWMTESLTRVLSFQKLNKESKVLLPEKFTRFEFVLKTIDMLGIDYQIYPNDSLVRVNNLYLTSHTAPAGNYNSKIILELHSKLNNGAKSVSGKRLWLSRKFSDRRYLSNEDELIPILKEYDVEIIYPEHFTYSQQIEMFRKAEFIGGVAGAALVNMLYMEMNKKVLELRTNNDELNNCHYSLAVLLNHKYFYEKCKSDSDENLTVDVQSLDNTLRNIFL